MTRRRMNFNNLEKLVEGDLNKLQQFLQLMAGEESRFMYGTEFPALVPAGGPTQQDVPIAHGLLVSQGGSSSTVTVSPGVLLQYSTTLNPTPITYETAYRQGLLLTAATVTLPTPGAQTYCLLQARVRQQTATESRPFFNTTTRAFNNSIALKEYTYDVEFSWVLGTSTNFPAGPSAGWVPIGGVVVTAANQLIGYPNGAEGIFDLRPRPREKLGFNRSRPQLRLLRTSSYGNTAPHGDSIQLSCEAVSSDVSTSNTSGGIKMQHHPNNSVSLASIPALSPVTAGTWYYIYLCPWNGVAPRRHSASTFLEGVLYATTVVPDRNECNSASFALPPPFANHTVNTGVARCVGALYRRPTGVGWMSCTGNDGMVQFAEVPDQAPGISGSAGGPSLGVVLSATSPQHWPQNAKRIKLRLSAQFNNTGATVAGLFAFAVHPSDGTTADSLAGGAWTTTFYAGNGNVFAYDVEIPVVRDRNITFQVTVGSPASGVNVSTMRAMVTGYSI